jgi:hypothetical protein
MPCRMLRDVYTATPYIAVTPTDDELSGRGLQQAQKGVRSRFPKPGHETLP